MLDDREALGDLALIDLRCGRAVFRLCGTNLLGRFGGEMTRREIDMLDEEIVGTLRLCMDEVRASRQPSRSTHKGVIGSVPTTFHEICLPLADDGTNMDSLLFASYAEQRK